MPTNETDTAPVMTWPRSEAIPVADWNYRNVLRRPINLTPAWPDPVPESQFGDWLMLTHSGRAWAKHVGIGGWQEMPRSDDTSLHHTAPSATAAPPDPGAAP